jgi:signal transduction histidine kinase
MAGRWTRAEIARWLSGALASVLIVAAASGLNALLKPWVSPLLALYVLAIMPVAVVWGTGLAVFAGALSAVVYDYLFVPPLHELTVPNLRTGVALGVYLVTAVVTGVLAARLRNAARAAARLSGEQAALRRVATLVAQRAPPEEVFAAVTTEIGQVLAADFTSMSRYDSDGTATVVAMWSRTGAPKPLAIGDQLSLGGRNLNTLVYQTGQPARIDDYKDSSGEFSRVGRSWGYRSAAGVPISVQDRLWGNMAVGYARTSAAPTDAERRLASFSELVATAVANAQAQAEVAASRARIVAAGDQARRRIERNLHDGAQQRLVTLALMLSGIRDRIPADLRADVDEARDELTATRREIRELSRGLHPAIVVEAGLGPAIRAMGRGSPLPVRVNLDIPNDGRLPGHVEVSAYYVVAEALTNAAKHARASAVTVQGGIDGDVLHITVRDDGVGGADSAQGTGLVGLKDRVEAIGGRIFLDSTQGAGTSLRAEFPLTVAAGGVMPGSLTRHFPPTAPPTGDGSSGQLPAEFR